MNSLSRQHYQHFVKGAFILTMATFIVKILSAVYRVPYQNIAGDVAFYIYQQVYPLYGVTLVFSTYGFPVIISKLIAERLEKEKRDEIFQVLLISFFFLFGLFSMLFLWFKNHTYEVASFLGDQELEPLIYVASFFFLVVPFSSVMKGYFQGVNNMIPTAATQVVEQVVRVSIIIIATLVLVPRQVDLYTVGATAILGGVIGSIIGVCCLIFFFLQKGKKHQRIRFSLGVKSSLNIAKTVLIQGLIICVANLVFILMQFIDSVTLYGLLVENGAGTEMAKVIKGVYDRGLPLIQVGSIVATSLSLSLVPLISMAYVRKEMHVIQARVALSLKITWFIGVAASVGLMCIAKPVNIMLFENSLGTNVLAILGYSILFGSMAIATATILQGLGTGWLIAWHVFIGGVIKVIGNLLLVPLIGEEGAAIATVVALAVIGGLNYLAIVYRVKLSIFKTMKARSAVVSSIIMAMVIMIITVLETIIFGDIEKSRALATGITFFNVGIGAGTFFILLVKYRLFSYKEVSLLTSNLFVRSIFKKVEDSK